MCKGATDYTYAVGVAFMVSSDSRCVSAVCAVVQLNGVKVQCMACCVSGGV